MREVIDLVLPVAIGVAGFIAGLELLFSISWRVVPLHASAPLAAIGARSVQLRSRRHFTASFIGWRLAWAPSSNIRRRVAELFPPELLLDPRPDARWQAWYNAHIPAFIARAAPPLFASRVISAIFDGFIDATRALTHGKTTIAFDEFWPILESIEEIAAHTHPNAHGCFADKMLELCTATTDETVQAASGWLVNELHERTANERCLGGVVIERLRVAAPHATRVALGLVQKTKDTLATDVSLPGSRGSEAVTSQMTAYDRAQGPAIRKLFSSSNARKYVEDLAVKSHKDGQPLLGIKGLTWMTLQRAAFRERCKKNPPEAFLQEICEALMACAEERRTCAFLVIEALEPIRDKFPEACVKAMCHTIAQSAGRFDQGVAVCVAEGFEEGGGGCKFARWKRKWDLPLDTKHESLGAAATSLLAQTKAIPRLEPIVGWMNLRLDLHESAERRSAKWATPAAPKTPAPQVERAIA